MRTIGVVTVGRSDYGLYRPVLHAIAADPELSLGLMVSGAHLAPEFGRTVRQIEADGFPVAQRVEMLLASDTPEGIAKSVGLGVMGFAQAYAQSRPDLLVVLGDRFEMYSAALAALPFKIPVAHIHGGELTAGAMDDALRHSLTKLSHLHFVAAEAYARRVAQLGEEPWRITVSGAPGIDNLRLLAPLTRAELEARCQLDLSRPPLLVTYHPVTLEYEQAEWQVGELLAALEIVQQPVIFTQSNADTAGRLVWQRITEYARGRAAVRLVDNLGTAGYFGLMRLAAAMVGNSSSGLIEAPSFELPVVNIGSRQAGRVRAANVIDTGYPRAEIVAGLQRALQPAFRAGLAGVVNPYGDGNAADRIVARLKSTPLDQRLLLKTFQDLG